MLWVAEERATRHFQAFCISFRDFSTLQSRAARNLHIESRMYCGVCVLWCVRVVAVLVYVDVKVNVMWTRTTKDDAREDTRPTCEKLHISSFWSIHLVQNGTVLIRHC